MKRINNLILAPAGLFAAACADTFEERYDRAVNTDRYSVTAEAGSTPQRDPAGKKPSIRAQLKADRAQSCKPQQREKEQEAKRSIRQALEME